MLNTLKTTTSRQRPKGNSLPKSVQTACGSWPNLQHVAPHKMGAMSPSNTQKNTKNITSSSTIVTRNMSIYDYLRQHLSRAKRQRSTEEDNSYSYSNSSSYSNNSSSYSNSNSYSSNSPLPAAKLRKHNYSNYRWERERERQEERERNGRTNNNASMDDYDIRFFFYLNSLILFTMSCSRQYEGDDLKHFICERIRKFDRLRRKARKRRKRRSKQLPL